MNKTQKILACAPHIQYRCIKDVVGCTEQLVYTVLKLEKSKYSTYEPRYKGKVLKEKPIVCDLEFEIGQSVVIEKDPRVWVIKFIGNEVLCLKLGSDIKSVTKDKISKIVSA